MAAVIKRLGEELAKLPDLDLDVLGVQVFQYRVIHLLEGRCFFYPFRTVVGLMCNTRAVARMPLAFIAISMICHLTSDDCPAYDILQEKCPPASRVCAAPIPLLPYISLPLRVTISRSPLIGALTVANFLGKNAV